MLSARRIGLGLLAVAVPLVAGCTDLGNPASAQGVTRNDLVADLAEQLAGSAASTYAATYQLAGGATATIVQAQHPLRAAYRYPGGEVVVTADATTRCARQVCTMTAPVAPPPAGTFAAAHAAGLITPAAVEDLLNAARMDPDVTVAQRDTTVAGRHATCVKLTNVDAARPSAGAPAPSPSAEPEVDAAPPGTFSTCITSDGTVGSFTGALQGTTIDVALTNYSDEVTGDAFDPPPAAKLVDRRIK